MLLSAKVAFSSPELQHRPAPPSNRLIQACHQHAMRCAGCIWIENETAGCSTRELMCLFKKRKDYVSRQLVRRGAYWGINGVTCRFRRWQRRDTVALQMERFPSVHIMSLSADGARNPLGDARHDLESDWTNLSRTDKPTT